MENDSNIDASSNAQQTVQDQVNQPTINPERTKVNNIFGWVAIIGIPLLIFGLIIFFGYPLSLLLVSVLFGDMKNVDLGFIPIILVANTLIMLFFGVVSGIVVFLITRKLKTFFLGFGIFMLIFVIYFLCMQIFVHQYFSSEVNKTIENANEVVGQENLIFTYVTSEPIYDSDRKLEEVRIIYKVLAPKSGDYIIDATLATPQVGEGSASQKIPLVTTFYKSKVSLTEKVPYNLVVPFKMRPLIEVGYVGKMNVYFQAWRSNLKIKGTQWDKSPITSWPINISDSGSSPNFNIDKFNRYKETVYSVGPFPVSRP